MVQPDGSYSGSGNLKQHMSAKQLNDFQQAKLNEMTSFKDDDKVENVNQGGNNRFENRMVPNLELRIDESNYQEEHSKLLKQRTQGSDLRKSESAIGLNVSGGVADLLKQSSFSKSSTRQSGK